MPAEAWQAFMVAAHEDLPPVPLPGDYQIGGAGGGQPEPSGEPVQIYVDQFGNYVDQWGNPVDRNGQPLDGQGMVSNEPQQQLPTTRGGADEGYEIVTPESQPDYVPMQEGEGQYAGSPDPYGDRNYGGPPPEYGYEQPARMEPPSEIGPARVVRQGELPPDAVLEGPVGRSIDRSLFRGLFGG